MHPIDAEHNKLTHDFILKIEMHVADYDARVITSDKAMELISLATKNLNKDLEQFYEKHK